MVKNMEYLLPIGKSDHVVIQFEMGEEVLEIRSESHKTGRYNYGRANYEELRRYFGSIDWTEFEKARGVEEKWKLLLEIYNKGVAKYLPRVKIGQCGKNSWLSAKCKEASNKKEESWRRWNRTKRMSAWEVYKRERNEY